VFILTINPAAVQVYIKWIYSRSIY